MREIILFNKPYGIVSQFTGDSTERTLAEFINKPGFYPAGRLDKKSEGLLLLTNDGKFQHAISHPSSKKYKTYWVQVEGAPSDQELSPLRRGLMTSKATYLPAKVKVIAPPTIWSRDPPIRFRANIPDSWLEIEIQEGKNHQVRHMTAAIGFPTLRLIRVQIGPYQLGNLAPGHWTLLHG